MSARVTVLYNIPLVSEGTPAVDRLSPEDPVGDVHAIQMALRELGHGAEILPVGGSAATLVHNLALRQPELVFNLCEGIGSESGKEADLAAAMDLLSIPYTGSGPLTLALALRKERTKEILRARGIPTPRSIVLAPGETPSRIPLEEIPFPVIVKPEAEDASLGLRSDSITSDPADLPALVARIHAELKCSALVEEFIDGREFNVAFLGERTLPISEIEFTGSGPRIVTYDGKWEPSTEAYRETMPRCPARLNPEITDRVVTIAREAYRALEVRDYGRVDLRMSAEGAIYVLEVNPNPDLSPDAGLARSAGAAGLSYTDLVREILAQALARAPVRA